MGVLSVAWLDIQIFEVNLLSFLPTNIDIHALYVCPSTIFPFIPVFVLALGISYHHTLYHQLSKIV